MKKAFKWMDTHGISYEFHDYKKQGVDVGVLNNAIATHSWENVINRRGTTWRKLDSAVKNEMNTDKAISLAQDNASIIKRPLIIFKDEITLGFDENTYKIRFKA